MGGNDQHRTRPVNPERLDIAETALGEEKPRPGATEVRLVFAQPKTNEETETQIAHQSPSDSSATTMNADPGLRREVVRGADSRGLRAG
jgi:hypothetical protein